MKKFLFICVLLLLVQPVCAVVEVARQGDPVMRIEEVYNLDGVAYISLDDVLEYLEVEGRWDSVAHLYHLPTPGGDAVFFPGGRYIRRGERFIPLRYPARFIDGRLRVPQTFLVKHLPSLLGEQIVYRNLDPPSVNKAHKEGAMDRLFSFLLRRKKSPSGMQLRAVAIDPGHGGEDVGVLGPKGAKEKDVNFSLALRLEKLLKMQLGIPVYLSRDGDYGLTTEQRLQPAQREDVDALLLLHAQSSFSPQHHGIKLLVRAEESERNVVEGEEGLTAEAVAPVEPARPNESRRLAGSLRKSLERAGFIVAGVEESPLFPLGRGDLPTVQVEVGYMSNPEDFADMREGQAQERLAQALFKGLKGYADLGKGGM